MNYRKSFWIMQGASWLFIVLLVIDIFLKLRWLTVIGLLLLIPAGIQVAKYYRCPHCGGRLNPRRFTIEKVCPHCHEELK